MLHRHRSRPAFVVALFVALALALGLTAWARSASSSAMAASSDELRRTEARTTAAPGPHEEPRSSWRTAGEEVDPAIEQGGNSARLVAGRTPAGHGSSHATKRAGAAFGPGNLLSSWKRAPLVILDEPSPSRRSIGTTLVSCETTAAWPSPRAPPPSIA